MGVAKRLALVFLEMLPSKTTWLQIERANSFADDERRLVLKKKMRRRRDMKLKQIIQFNGALGPVNTSLKMKYTLDA